MTRRRVLALTPQVPYPPHQGTTIRNFHILKRLARHAEVDLVTFIEMGQPDPQQTPLGHICRNVWHHPVSQRRPLLRLIQTFFSGRPDMGLRLYTPQMAGTVADIARREHYDVLLVEGIEMAPYLFVFLDHAPPDARPHIVFDDHNAEYLLQKRAFLIDARQPRRWHAALYSLVQWRKLVRYETRVCRQADHILAVSAADRDALARLRISTPITVIPNGIDLAFYSEGMLGTPETITAMAPLSVVFTGKMDFRPNIDAVLWFLDMVWPRVQAMVPEAQFYIVGRSPHPRVLSRASTPGVFITGEVADVRPYIGQARVYVAPLRVGGGTRLKLLEAMAMRRPIVSTTLGAEGYPVRHGEHLLLADAPEAFADAVVTLLQDPATGERLGTNAFQFVSERYDWDTLFPRLMRVLAGDVPGDDLRTP